MSKKRIDLIKARLASALEDYAEPATQPEAGEGEEPTVPVVDESTATVVPQGVELPETVAETTVEDVAAAEGSEDEPEGEPEAEGEDAGEAALEPEDGNVTIATEEDMSEMPVEDDTLEDALESFALAESLSSALASSVESFDVHGSLSPATVKLYDRNLKVLGANRSFEGKTGDELRSELVASNEDLVGLLGAAIAVILEHLIRTKTMWIERLAEWTFGTSRKVRDHANRLLKSPHLAEKDLKEAFPDAVKLPYAVPYLGGTDVITARLARDLIDAHKQVSRDMAREKGVVKKIRDATNDWANLNEEPAIMEQKAKELVNEVFQTVIGDHGVTELSVVDENKDRYNAKVMFLVPELGIATGGLRAQSPRHAALSLEREYDLIRVKKIYAEDDKAEYGIDMTWGEVQATLKLLSGDWDAKYRDVLMSAKYLLDKDLSPKLHRAHSKKTAPGAGSNSNLNENQRAQITLTYQTLIAMVADRHVEAINGLTARLNVLVTTIGEGLVYDQDHGK